MDRGYLKYIMHELRCDRETPYQMTNEALANEMFPYIKEGIPSAQIIKTGKMQMIIVSPKAREEARKRVESMINDQKRAIKKLQDIIAELDRHEE